MYSDKQLNKVLETMNRGQGKQRYKGLGEMNPEQLWETTARSQSKPAQVSVKDATRRPDITTLMSTRWSHMKFIEQNARYVCSLDV